MPKLKTIPWRKFEKFLLFVGCVHDRTRGDHKIYIRSGLRRPIVLTMEGNVPIHILKNNLRELKVGNQEFLDILKKS
ncbi:MAG: type II toxin-antitoxin system HicA family toxin [Patescibacteria group bacterium]